MRQPRSRNTAAGAGAGQTAPAGPSPRRILGIDPGTILCGWGIVESSGGDVEHIASGVIRARGSRAQRLMEICDIISDVCARFVPFVLSLEQSFVGDNVQSAFRLGEARGAIMVAACRARLEVAEYSPAQIKVAVAGSGRASKAQMQLMVGRLLGVGETLAEDEADALGVAICHAYAGRFNTLVAQADGWGGAGRAGRGSWRR